MTPQTRPIPLAAIPGPFPAVAPLQRQDETAAMPRRTAQITGRGADGSPPTRGRKAPKTHNIQPCPSGSGPVMIFHAAGWHGPSKQQGVN